MLVPRDMLVPWRVPQFDFFINESIRICMAFYSRCGSCHFCQPQKDGSGRLDFEELVKVGSYMWDITSIRV